MALIVAVLALISLVAGGFLGTFRHRAYGVWSLAGVLIAMTTANIAGTSIGLWMATSIGTAEASPVLAVVKTVVLVVVALMISYYASDLLPTRNDPKTRGDNIMAGSLGVFNAYLIVATVFQYIQVVNNPTVANIFGNGEEFNFNRLFIDGLPWISSILVLVIFGWSSVRKFKQAWAKLRGTTNTPPPAVAAVPSSPNYGSSYSASYTPVSTPAPSAANEGEAKKSWLAGVAGWFRRDSASDDTDQSSATMNAPQTPVSSSYSPSTSTYQGTSGATPPYGISTSATSGSSSYTGYTAPSSPSSYSSSTGYTTSSADSTGYSSGYTPAQSYNTTNTGYSVVPSSPTTPSTPQTPTTSYNPSSTSGYSSGYTTSTPSSTPSYSTGYGATSTTSSFGTYNPSTPSTTSGFNPSAPTTPPSPPTNSTGSTYPASYGNASFGGGFADLSAYQDSDDDDDYFGEDDEDDSQDGYPPSYRG